MFTTVSKVTRTRGYRKLLITGRQGWGKSHLANKLTTGMRRAILDCERGFHPYFTEIGDEVNTPGTVKEFVAVCRHVIASDKFDALIIDGILTIWAMVLADSTSESWAMANFELLLRDLVAWKGNVILTQRGKRVMVNFQDVGTVPDTTDVFSYYMDTTIVYNRGLVTTLKRREPGTGEA